MRQLRRLLGRKTLENEIHKKGPELARPEQASLQSNVFAAVLAGRGRFPMKVVADECGWRELVVRIWSPSASRQTYRAPPSKTRYSSGRGVNICSGRSPTTNPRKKLSSKSAALSTLP